MGWDFCNGQEMISHCLQESKETGESISGDKKLMLFYS